LVRRRDRLADRHVPPPEIDLTDSRAGLEKAERVGDPALLALAIARLATAESLAAIATPGLLERGAEIEEHCGLELQYFESPLYLRSRHLLRLGEIDRSRVILEELEAKSAARGDEGSRAMILWTLGMLEWFAGSWKRALEHATAAHDLTEQTQHSHGRVWVGRVKALVEADLGFVDQARASAEESVAFSKETSNEYGAIITPGLFGRLELALGNLEAAAGYLRSLPGRLLAAGLNEPTATVWADAIETLVAVGELPQARDYLEQHEVHAQRIGSPWAVAGAARCWGLLAAAEGDLTVSFEAFERALGTLEGLQYPLERGRTLLCLGSVRRQAQQKTASREALEQALAIFEALGARPVAQHVRNLLRQFLRGAGDFLPRLLALFESFNAATEDSITRLPELFDPASIENRDGVRHLDGFLLIVRHENAGEMQFVVQTPQPAAQLVAHLAVECAEGLVQQQHIGSHGQRARQRHTLPLAAR
jgi:tetratricopeptide (TPR) repeat protein